MRVPQQRRRVFRVLAILVCAFFATALQAQTPAVEDDPVKLFERGQDAHAKNDFKTAIEFYDAAIRLKPEFPEAEFQRAMALLYSNQKEEALKGFNRAVELRPDWAMAYSKFGSHLGSYGNDPATAEPILRKAIELDPKDEFAMTVLAEIRVSAGDMAEALKLIRLATSQPAANSATWRKRAQVESAAGDKIAALASIDKAVTLEGNSNRGARFDRAKLRLAAGDQAGALEDIRALERSGHGGSLPGSFELAQFYARVGQRDDALRILDAMPERDRQVPEVVALRAEIAGGDGSSAEQRAALEQLLERDPKNVSLLARLGAAYRRIDPNKSQDFYYRALQIEPDNSKFAIGYASALIQGRRFAEAVPILRAVLARTPEDYLAHANLGLALYELKDFPSAITEYEWIATARPEVAATYFFLASAHDNLQQYPDALAAYEKFLARADATTNKLEIEKVNLRLPILRDQIKRGQGKRRTE